MPMTNQSDLVRVAIHRTAQPAEFAAGLRRSLAARRLDPKFHYTGARQAQAWLALHRKYSPFVIAPDGPAVYDTAFAWVAAQLSGGPVHLVSLACGGAGKEVRLARTLQRAGLTVTATVSDISVPLVLAGVHALKDEAGLTEVQAVALDLLVTADLPGVLTASEVPGSRRVVTCFGLMPNVDPAQIAAQLATLLRPNDLLLVGANLVPEEDYAASTQAVLGQYDNAETRAWLGLLLTDCGFEPGDGEMRFTVQPCASLTELLQIVGHYRLHRDRTLELDGKEIKFLAGEELRLFFSNRYTPARLRRVFERVKMKIPGEWVSAGKTEGVIACQLTNGVRGKNLQGLK